MKKQDAQIAWLKEKSDFEGGAAQNLMKDVSKSDRKHIKDSDRIIYTEQSAIEIDEAVPSSSQAAVYYNVFNNHSRGHLYMADVAVSQNTIVDSKSFYTSNLYVYAGKQLKGEFSVDNSSSALMKRLSRSILNTPRNINNV